METIRAKAEARNTSRFVLGFPVALEVRVR